MGWLPYVYQYGIGGLLLLVGLLYAWRQGDVGLRGRGLRNLVLVLGGLAFFMLLQGYLQFVATRDPELPRGPAGPAWTEHGVLGAPVDYALIVLYFIVILGFGSLFGRHTRTTRDFFFGGQRFSWWLIAMSLVATTVGSYSFIKYSRVGFEHGFSSTQSYLNDWFWVPLFLFGWLPIIYYSRVRSIPEYFERRFGRGARHVVTALLLIYMIGYIGVNFYTLGKAMHGLLGWDVFWSAALVAMVCAIYVTAGGQTAVIMTDLVQGVLLLVAGGVLLYLGIDNLGGFDQFWGHLRPDQRAAFSNFNQDPKFNMVGIFWQDAIANSATFIFLNQGLIMRFLAVKSVPEARKALVVTMIVLMPLAAIVVAGGGWVGSAMVHAGLLDPATPPDTIFVRVSYVLCRPGVFGLVMAALTAALMSTADTLINAVSAIVVNDIVRPFTAERLDDQAYLRVARWTSVGVSLVGLALVPFFMQFDSIYAAHGAFTAAVTPPMVVAVILGVFWRRYTGTAALWTMAGGAALIALSFVVPDVIAPFAHGIPRGGEYHTAWVFPRALYGLVVSTLLGVVATAFTQPEAGRDLGGLVWGSIGQAMQRFKGSTGRERSARGRLVSARGGLPLQLAGPMDLPLCRLTAALMQSLEVAEGDLVYVADRRRWLGGLRSAHMVVGPVVEGEGELVLLPDAIHAEVGAKSGRARIEAIL
ncbi:MAG: sodium/solute symporter [Pseudomonadota bacterium]